MTRCRTELLGLSTLLAAGNVGVGMAGTCTLLGPEGPGAAKAAAEPLDLFLFAGAAGRRGRYRPYFENYTVDASIFEMAFVE